MTASAASRSTPTGPAEAVAVSGADGAAERRWLRGAGRSGALLFALFVTAAAVFRHAPVHDRPWDDSIASVVDACYQGRIQRTWDRVGFARTSGRSFLRAVRDDPDSRPGAASAGVDTISLHPPPLFTFMVHAAVVRFG